MWTLQQAVTGAVPLGDVTLFEEALRSQLVEQGLWRVPSLSYHDVLFRRGYIYRQTWLNRSSPFGGGEHRCIGCGWYASCDQATQILRLKL